MFDFNLQSVVAHTTKHVNRAVNSAAIAAETATLAWALSDERNKALVKAEQQKALANLF
jgi:hypothetical protein